MIAIGNHIDFDSLRVAPRTRKYWMYFQGRWISCGEKDSVKTVSSPMDSRLRPSSFLRFLGFSLLFYGCSIIMILYENPENREGAADQHAK